MSDPILLEREGAVATLILNRPEKLNALTRDAWEMLANRLAELAGDGDLRCLVLRGAGEKAFSPGNDIAEFETERANAEQAAAYGAFMRDTLHALRDFPAPTVAQIHGICVGGGLEIAGSCDIRICGASSRFGAPIKNLGLVMAHAELEALIGLVGPAVAKEILFEGRIFGAEEALQKGIVTRIVPDAEVASEAAASAARIAEGAPLVARWHKKFTRQIASGATLSDADLAEGFACFDTEDFRIGYQAFLAKEKPDFTGR